jgi:hypothetical protein
MARKYDVVVPQVVGAASGLATIQRKMDSREEGKAETKFQYDVFIKALHFGNHIADLTKQLTEQTDAILEAKKKDSKANTTQLESGVKNLLEKLEWFHDCYWYGADLKARAGNKPEEETTFVTINGEKQDIMTWPRPKLAKAVNAALTLGKQVKGYNAFVTASKLLVASGEATVKDDVFSLVEKKK